MLEYRLYTVSDSKDIRLRNMKQKPRKIIYSQVSFRIRDTSIVLYITIDINIYKKMDFQDGLTY